MWAWPRWARTSSAETGEPPTFGLGAGGGAGSSARSYSSDSTPGALTVGTRTMMACPQPGHLTLRSPFSGLTESFLPHLPQVIVRPATGIANLPQFDVFRVRVTFEDSSAFGRSQPGTAVPHEKCRPGSP